MPELDEQRQSLITDLFAYMQQWPAEDKTIQTMIEFISSNPMCFERSSLEGHMTGAAWLVDPTMSKVLLTHHRKLDKWLQLGGHADGLSDIRAVSRSEASEESGIASIDLVSPSIFDIDIHLIPANHEDREHLHYDVRYAFVARKTEYNVSEESHDLAWVSIRDLAAYTNEPSMIRMATKWLEHRPMQDD